MFITVFHKIPSARAVTHAREAVRALRRRHRALGMTDKPERIGEDSMGEMTVPADALHGTSTHRAVLNFPVAVLGFRGHSFTRSVYRMGHGEGG